MVILLNVVLEYRDVHQITHGCCLVTLYVESHVQSSMLESKAKYLD